MATGRLDFSPAVTHRIPFQDLPETYTALESGSLKAGAVAVVWTDGESKHPGA